MKTWMVLFALLTGINVHAADIPDECRASLEEQKAYFSTITAKAQMDFERGAIGESEKAATEQLILGGKESVATRCMYSIIEAANANPVLRAYYTLNTQTLERRGLAARQQALQYLNE